MKLEKYAMRGVSLYKEMYPEHSGEYIVTCDDYVTYKSYEGMVKNGTIKSIKTLSSDDIVIASGYSKGTRGYLANDKNGVFGITLKNGKNIIVIRWVTYAGGARRYEGVRIGLEGDIIRLQKDIEKNAKKHQKPKLGVYRCDSDPNGNVIYVKKKAKEYPDTTVIHPLVDDIESHIAHYFANVKMYTVNNRAGRKSILLHGPQGTGKSSIAYRLARKHGDVMNVAFVTNAYCLYTHVESCAKHSVPTIVVFEDCEGSLSRNDGEVKNFLSGIDASQNKAGCYIIMTTNYPQKIEKTIIKRKGRIDRLYYIGKLSGEYLERCISLYMDPVSAPKERSAIKKYLVGIKLSGSEVETLTQECLNYASKDGRNAITEQDVIDMYEEMMEEMKGIEYDESDYNLGGRNSEKIGF